LVELVYRDKKMKNFLGNAKKAFENSDKNFFAVPKSSDVGRF